VLDYSDLQQQQQQQFFAPPPPPAPHQSTDVDDLSYVDDDLDQYGDLLTMTSLRRWDYPVFELSDRCPDTLLSRVRTSASTSAS